MKIARVRSAAVLGAASFAVAVLAAAAFAACGVDGGSPPVPADSSASNATSSAASVAPLVTIGPPPEPTPSDDAEPLTLDPNLLAWFPETVAQIPVTEDADEAALALSDPALPRIATAVDAAAAVDAASGNLVFAWIVQLRPDVFTDADYRQWRDSYDEGACAASGEIVGRAEADVGGRHVYVTSCAAGLHTYHAWLEDHDLLISASAIGEGRFGELLLAGLRFPA